MYSRRGLLVDRYPARGASNTTSTTIYDTNPAVGSIVSGAGYVAAPGSVISLPIETKPGEDDGEHLKAIAVHSAPNPTFYTVSVHTNV
jgi:hypothetical protein